MDLLLYGLYGLLQQDNIMDLWREAIWHALRITLWTCAVSLAVVVMFFMLTGCVSTEVHIGNEPPCIESKARIVLGKLVCIE